MLTKAERSLIARRRAEQLPDRIRHYDIDIYYPYRDGRPEGAWASRVHHRAHSWKRKLKRK